MPVAPLVDPGPELTREQLTRYARHLLMPALGEGGQRRLLAARVAVVGAGGLGSPALLYLAGAGVGRITVIDDDVVDTTNLQRQVIHDLAAVGTPKVASAVRRVRELNPDVEIVGHQVRLDESNVDELLAGHDLVLDGVDNFTTRYVTNDACARLGIPFVWASVFRTEAQVSVFWKEPRGVTDAAGSTVPGVDLRDLFPTAPDPALVPACGDAGVLGSLVGQAGAVMATEAIKLITGQGEPLLGRVLFLDVLSMRTREISLRPRRSETAPWPASTSQDQASEPAAPDPPATPFVSVQEVAARITAGTAPVLLDVREDGEVALGALPGSTHVPLGVLRDDPTSSERLVGDREVVVYCKAGPRAALAAELLVARGHTRVSRLEGGMIAWIDDIDPTLPRY